jgi:hypothetical protein
LAALAAIIFAGWLAPGPGDAAIVKSVTSGTASLPNSVAATQVALTGVDITKAFVLCSTRTANTTPDVALYTCDLNTGGAGGAARLTITPSAAPGNATTRVQYYVVEFDAGVSVQRGTTTFNGTSGAGLTQTPAISSVDCSKSFVLTSVRSVNTNNNRDEQWKIRATLGSAATPCTTTTTSLELARIEGAAENVTVAWQVVTYEGASVQRGTSCIGGAAASCTTNAGGTSGLSNRITLGTAVDTSKSFIVATSTAGSAIAGVEGEHLMRAEFVSTGTSVTGIQFARSQTVTTNNHQLLISYEVVTLTDGSTVQTGTGTITGTNATGTATLTTVDTTRTAVFFSVSGGDSGSAARLDDTSLTGTLNGSDGASGSSITFTRLNTTNVGTVSAAWFAVSFFRCNPASGIDYDTLCTLGVSSTGTSATALWSSVNTVIVLHSTSSIAATPVNGTSYSAGQTISGVTVLYSGSVATDTSVTQSGLTVGTTYYYKAWAKAGPGGACTTAPCYVAGSEQSFTPRTGGHVWSSIVVGGAALNPAVAGTGRMSFGTNDGKLVSVNSTTGAWAGVPANTLNAVPGYVSVFPYGAGEMVVGGDQSGWVYAVNPATGAYYWVRQLGADTIQAAVSTYLRGYFSSNMTAAYPGTYDIIFVATMNNTASGGYTNNKVFALRSDTGATLWTFSPATLSSGLCPSGCPMDQVVGQPWVDYVRDRLYVASRDGSAGTQNSLWFLDIANAGALVAKYSGADFTTGPSQSRDGNSLWIGDEAGVLHIVNLATLGKTTNSVASGTAFKGFVWEDFNIAGRLYFVTTDGNVWGLLTPTTNPATWKRKPVAGGTVSQMLPSDVSLWVGGSDGDLYQLNLTSGLQEGSSFPVGGGTNPLSAVTTETGDELYVATSTGRLYKIMLTGGDLP